MKRFSFVRYFIIAFLLLIGAFLGIVFIGRSDQKLKGYGIIESENIILLTSRTSGILSNIYIGEGDFVQKNAFIAKIRDRDLQMQLESSKSKFKDAELKLKESEIQYNIEKALQKKQEIRVLKEKVLKSRLNSELKRKDFEIKERLYKEELVSLKELNEAEINYEIALSEERASKEDLRFLLNKQITEELKLKNEYERAKSNFLLAKKEYEETRKRLSEATIKSPINGVILTVEKKEGELLLEGQRFGSIAPLNEVKFTASIPGDKVPLLKENLEANIYIDAFPFRKFKIFKGRVDRISPKAAISQTGPEFKVSIKMDSHWVDFQERGKDSRIFLRPGLGGKAEIIVRKNIRISALIIDSLLKR